MTAVLAALAMAATVLASSHATVAAAGPGDWPIPADATVLPDTGRPTLVDINSTFVPDGPAPAAAGTADEGPPPEPQDPVGPTDAEVSAWHHAGIRGDGVEVTVAAIGFDGATALIGTALPASTVTRFGACGPDGDHGATIGTALAETVATVAPDAALTLACVRTVDDVSAIAADPTADIVLLAVSDPLEGRAPYTARPGTLAAAVETGTRAGQLWVTDAGEYNVRGLVERVRLTDPDRDGVLVGTGFAVAAGGTAMFSLTWGTPGSAAGGRVRLCAWYTGEPYSIDTEAPSEDNFVGCTQPSTPGAAAAGIELTNQRAETAGYSIAVVSEGMPRAYDAVIGRFGDVASFSSGILFEPTAPGDHIDALAVGALCTPNNGTDVAVSRSHHDDHDPKPDLWGRGTASTVTYGDDERCFGIDHSSLVAAAHAGGVAALVADRYPELRGHLLRRELEATTAVSTEGRPDHGEVRLLDPAAAPLTDTTPRPLRRLDEPARVLDTRRTTGPLGPTTTVTVTFDPDTVPADTTAVVLNVTAVTVAGAGHLVVVPGGTRIARPGDIGYASSTSNLNYRHDQAIAASVTVPVTHTDAGATIDLGNVGGHTNVIVDLVATYGADGTEWFAPLDAPTRYVDTRVGTVHDDRTARLGPGERATFPIADTGLVPDDATAVALTVTTVGGSGRGHVSVVPAGATASTSSLNYDTTGPRPNLVVVGLADGAFDLVNARLPTVDVVIDVLGYWREDPGGVEPGLAGYVAVRPTRFLDQRHGYGAPAGGYTAAAGTSVRIRPRRGVSADATAVLVNVTVTSTRGTSYATVWDDARARPTASTVNFRSGQNASNATIVAATGDLRIAGPAAFQAIADIHGYFRPRPG